MDKYDPGNLKKWFMGGAEADAEIKELFAADIEAIQKGEYDSWKESTAETLAGIILMDQFTRNMYRGTAAMYDAPTLPAFCGFAPVHMHNCHSTCHRPHAPESASIGSYGYIGLKPAERRPRVQVQLGCHGAFLGQCARGQSWLCCPAPIGEAVCCAAFHACGDRGGAAGVPIVCFFRTPAETPVGLLLIV